METWFIILSFLCISLSLKYLFTLLFPCNPTAKLPPGPDTLPVIGNLLWLRKISELGPIIRSLRPKYGPLITLQIGSQPNIFVLTHSLAHQALIQNGAVFANRPPATPTNIILNGSRQDIGGAAYGSTWSVLRRNLASQTLYPSLMKSYSHARRHVLGILVSKLKENSSHGEAVHVVDHFQSAMFHVLVLLCFGEKVDENRIEELESIQRRVVLNSYRFNILSFWPRLGKIVFRKRWNELLHILRSQEDAFIPLIRARSEVIEQEKLSKSKEENKKAKEFVPYVDTLFDLHLPDEDKEKLDEGDLVSLCSEFLIAGSDTVSTTLVWIMANLVKHPHIQSKLFAEISEVVVESSEKEIEEEDLSKMPYLKAVILEGLRRHPPVHLVLPHSVTQDVTLGGCVIPKNATVNFLIAEMGRDPDVWEDPMEFKPERFMNSSDDSGGELVVDITGSKELKMMPSGAGRRICPGYGLAMLHLKYFVANLVWCFEWKAVNGDDVDLSEKLEFMMVMKNPLKAQISERVKSEYVIY